ncbi:MAG: AsmA-like C-terminal region-containing protein [Gammaproteobacteria bacterium WSBS_2016_MAG_OTU1]
MRFWGKLLAIAFIVLLILIVAVLGGVNFILQNESKYKISNTLTNKINQHIPGAKIDFSSAKLQFGWKGTSIHVADLRLSDGDNTLIAPSADIGLKTDGVIIALDSPDITFVPADGQVPLVTPLEYWAIVADNAVIRWHDKVKGISLTLNKTDVNMRYENGEMAAEIISHHPRNKLQVRAQLYLQNDLRGTVHAVLAGWEPPPQAKFNWDDMNITARVVIDNTHVQFTAASEFYQPQHSRVDADVSVIKWYAEGDYTVGKAATISLAVVGQELVLDDFVNTSLDADVRGVLTYENKNNRWYFHDGKVVATVDSVLLTARVTAHGYETTIESAAAYVRLANISLNSLGQYIKDPESRQWVVSSLLEGIIENGYVNLHADFLPTLALHTNITATFRDGQVKIGEGWPVARQLNGVMVLQDDNIRIVGEGMMAGVVAEEVTMNIFGITAPQTTLFINTRFERTAWADYLAALKQLPPTRQIAATYTKGLELSGEAKLSLMLAVPLATPQEAVFMSHLQVQNGQVQSGDKLPPLKNLAGEVRADNNGGQIQLKGTLQGEAITVYADNKKVLLQGKIAASTALSMAGLDDSWASGLSKFSLAIVADNTVFMSDLYGMQINLPPPFGKPPLVSSALFVQASGQQKGLLKFGGNVLHVVGGGLAGGVDVAVNADSLPPPPAGVRLHGDINQLRSDIDYGEIVPFSFAGTLLYHPGLVQANLAHWTMPNISSTGEAIDFDMRDLTVDIAIDELQFGKVFLGTLALNGAPYLGGWQLQQMLLTGSGNTLSLSGRYNGAQTSLAVRLNAVDAPKLLGQFNLDDLISEGNLLVDGHILWRDTPLNFSLDALGGQLNLRAEGLRYLKVSGNNAINLLAIFSPQSLLSLGFTEIGKEGFYIDLLTGEIIFANGQIIFEEVLLKNDDLDISLQGETEWKNKNLNINGRVRPGHKVLRASSIVTIGAGVAAITPATLAAGWLLGKIFEKQLSEIGAYNYQIGGTWEDPVYTETGITVIEHTPAP